MKCLNCDEEASVGFATCSLHCNLENRAEAGQPKEYPPIPPGLVRAEDIAQEFGTTTATVHQWAHRNKIPSQRFGPRTVRFDLVAVRAALGRPTEPRPEPEKPRGDNSLEFIRPRALTAAKRAFREVILEAADECKAAGDFILQAKLLEDFIFFEDGLELVYQGRKL